MARGALKLRELLDRLKPYGVEALPSTGSSKRGKSSEIILVKSNTPGSRQGPQYSIKNHGMGRETDPHVIDPVLRRFGISKAEFWGLPPKNAIN